MPIITELKNHIIKPKLATVSQAEEFFKDVKFVSFLRDRQSEFGGVKLVCGENGSFYYLATLVNNGIYSESGSMALRDNPTYYQAKENVLLVCPAAEKLLNRDNLITLTTVCPGEISRKGDAFCCNDYFYITKGTPGGKREEEIGYVYRGAGRDFNSLLTAVSENASDPIFKQVRDVIFQFVLTPQEKKAFWISESAGRTRASRAIKKNRYGMREIASAAQKILAELTDKDVKIQNSQKVKLGGQEYYMVLAEEKGYMFKYRNPYEDDPSGFDVQGKMYALFPANKPITKENSIVLETAKHTLTKHGDYDNEKGVYASVVVGGNTIRSVYLGNTDIPKPHAVLREMNSDKNTGLLRDAIRQFHRLSSQEKKWFVSGTLPYGNLGQSRYR